MGCNEKGGQREINHEQKPGRIKSTKNLAVTNNGLLLAVTQSTTRSSDDPKGGLRYKINQRMVV